MPRTGHGRFLDMRAASSEQEILDQLFAGESEMAGRMRAFDWAKTPIGPVSSWSPTLRTLVPFLLANRFPLLLWWGSEYIQLYNDAYAPILGKKHPRGLGLPVRECWDEIWHILRPLIDTPFEGGPATWVEDFELEIFRHGFMEETHFTVAYSPVPDPTAPGGIGGVLATVHETTHQMIQERRVRMLSELGARMLEARTPEDAGRIACSVFEENPKDTPFAAVYLLDEAPSLARLAATAGIPTDSVCAPSAIELADAGATSWPIAEAIASGRPVVIDDLAARFRDVPHGPWDDRPTTAVALPIPSPLQHRPAGVIVFGVSARSALDTLYRSFIELATGQVGTAVSNARAYETERKRAEALAELDRAKTAFFSNVSHEFRTPLTLMLGPLEDALAAEDEALGPRQTERLDVAHRNSLRLLKLVNTLLDFSRIEAGRIEAAYEETDLGAFTEELASVFRAAVERAGLTLEVAHGARDVKAFVDREMWEKVVLNLLSNAFKFTLSGGISVAIEQRGAHVVTTVRDTGTGIPSEELGRIFERFHRVRGVQGRTQEGSGIGLALVLELVKLHGGTVAVASQLGVGTTFTITIPTGSAHLPKERLGAARTLASTGLGAAPYVHEALRWLPDSAQAPQPEEVSGTRLTSVSTAGARVLVVDDNRDLRDYLRRLLAVHWRVEVAANGEEALARIRSARPDLVLCDVMMPKLDGFGLLKAVREDPATLTLPVILLSARAGEEARVEGLDAGADDYLTKPFSARELLARVNANLEIARTRDAFLAESQAARIALEDSNRRKDEFLAMLAHELRNPLAPVLNAVEVLRALGSREPRLEHARDIIHRQVVHMTRLIDDLLDVSRITRGRIELRKERLALSEVVDAAVEATRPHIEQHGHTLAINAADGLWVDGDRARLVQVLTNLLANAAKFTPSGGHVALRAVRDGSRAIIAVRDTGIGIAKEARERIFDLFAQEDPSFERSQGGLGIGLTLSQRLVEMHGGSLVVKSDGLGKGAEFIVSLALVPGTEQAERSTTVTSHAVDGHLRILVVEDNEDAAQSFKLLLELSGHVVEVARDGLQALRSIEQFSPDLAFLDIGLPGIDGFEVAERVRSQGGKRPLLVALSGYGREEDKQRAVRAGFDEHLTKPVEHERIRALLAKLGAATLVTASSDATH